MVDLANIRVPVDEHEKVLMGDKLQDPFLFEYIDHIKTDIHNLGIRVPVFFLLDALVSPFDMTEDEQNEFEARLRSSVFDDNHIWRIGSRYQKADYAICDLVNELGAMVISSDRFKDHIQNGTIRRPKDLLQFSPRRTSKFVNHRFVNIAHGGRYKTPLDLISQPTDEDEYWQEWLLHAEVIIPFLDQNFATSARDEIQESKLFKPMPEPVAPKVLEPVRVHREPLKVPKKRPEKYPIIYCGDLWGLSKNIDNYVQVVGRLFRDDNSWELRDFAAAPAIKATGAPKFKGFKAAQWIACEGILRRNNIGYYLESPEWAPVNGVQGITSIYSQLHKKRRFQTWGSPPWARSRQILQEELTTEDVQHSEAEQAFAPAASDSTIVIPEEVPTSSQFNTPSIDETEGLKQPKNQVPKIKKQAAKVSTSSPQVRQQSSDRETKQGQHTYPIQAPTETTEKKEPRKQKWLSWALVIVATAVAIATATVLIF